MKTRRNAQVMWVYELSNSWRKGLELRHKGRSNQLAG